MQLELFSGEHVPILRCRRALGAGDLDAAVQALERGSGDLRERFDLARLRLLAKRLASSAGTPEGVHDAFAVALADEADAPGLLDEHDWFQHYAQRMAGVLRARPAQVFRGWLGVHFALEGCSPHELGLHAAALLDASRVPGHWLEAARTLHAAEDPGGARRALLAACLMGEALDPEPPSLSPAGPRALRGELSVLPRLPPDLEGAFWEAHSLGLAAPTAAWVPALAVLDRLAPADPTYWKEVGSVARFDPGGTSPPGESPARAFLRSLLAAHRAREREPRRVGSCSEAELDARRRMKAQSPELFGRYMADVGWLFERR